MGVGTPWRVACLCAVDSTTYLVKMLEDPAAHGVDPARTTVLHQLTGSQ
ncbi:MULTISPECIES: hypothetical protein [unclassified Streptomyces]